MLCMRMHAMMMGSPQGHGQPQGPTHPDAPQTAHPISALELLKLRYVKGEITRAQLEEMRQVLAEIKEG